MNAKCMVSECFTCLGSKQRVDEDERIMVKGYGGEAKGGVARCTSWASDLANSD